MKPARHLALLLVGWTFGALGGCDAPEADVPEHEVYPDDKSDGVTFPAIALRQALELDGFSQTHNRATGRNGQTRLQMRFLVQIQPSPPPPPPPPSDPAPADLATDPTPPVVASAGMPLQFRLCSMSITTSEQGGATYTLQPAATLYNALPTDSGALRFFATTATASVRARTAAPIPLVIGASLTNAATDPLPTNATDPRVLDIDGDHHPGASLGMWAGSVFAAVRVVFRLDGTVVASSNGALLGGNVLVDAADVVAYGDSIPFFDAVSQLAGARQNTDVLSQSYTFTTVHMPAAFDCNAVRAAAF